MSTSVASASGPSTSRRASDDDEDVQMVDSSGQPLTVAPEAEGSGTGGDGDEEGDDGDDEEYEIEHIVSHSDVMIDDQMSYFVKWKGYPDSENSWVFESDMGGAQEMIQEYWAKLPKKTLKKMGTKAGSKKGKRTSSLGAAVTSPAVKESNRRRGARESSSLRAGHTAHADSPASTRRGATSTTTTPGRAGGRFEPQPSRSPSPSAAAELQISDEDPTILRIRSDTTLTDTQKQVLEHQHLQALRIDRMRRKYAKIPDWDPIVSKIESIEKMHSNKIRFFVKFESGDRLAFESTVCHHRCPLKVIEFYESHLRFKTDTNRREDEPEALRGDQDTEELEAWKQKQAEEEQNSMQKAADAVEQGHVNGNANGSGKAALGNGVAETGEPVEGVEGQVAPQAEAGGEGEGDETQETFQDAPAATVDEEAEDMVNAATEAAGIADEGETSADVPGEVEAPTLEAANEAEGGAEAGDESTNDGTQVVMEEDLEQVEQGDGMQDTEETTI